MRSLAPLFERAAVIKPELNRRPAKTSEIQLDAAVPVDTMDTAGSLPENFQVTIQQPEYRVSRIDIQRADAIDQIKFVYTDGTEWSCGHEGGKRDKRAVVLSEGEYVVEVHHEEFVNYRSAGAGVDFTTSKGRVFSYHPNRMATQLSDEVVKYKAPPGHEIVGLKIVRGVMLGATIQPVPVKLQQKATKQWFVLATTAGIKEDGDGNDYQHFCNWVDAKDAYKSAESWATLRSERAAVLIDAMKMLDVRTCGCRETIAAKTKPTAIADGFLTSTLEEEVCVWHAVRTLASVLTEPSDITIFATVVMLLMLASYLGLTVKMLTGKVLTMMTHANPAELLEDCWIINYVCSHYVSCPDDTTRYGVQQLLLVSWVLLKMVNQMVYVLQVYIHHNACEMKNKRLKQLAFAHVLSLDQAFFDKTPINEIRSGMNVHTLSNMITWNIPYLINRVLKGVMTVYFMAQINLKLATVVLGFTLLIKFGLLDVVEKFEKNSVRIERKLRQRDEQVVGDATEMISTVKMFSTEAAHAAEHDATAERVLKNLKIRVLLRCVREFFHETLQTICFGACFYIGLQSVVESNISGAELTAFFLMLHDFKETFNSFKWHWEVLRRELPDLDRYLTLMETKNVEEDGEMILDRHKMTGRIQFMDVEFEYPSRPGERVLSKLNLEIKANAVTAIVGCSGAGKSTIAKLLTRAYSPTSGSILLDGRNIRDFTSKSLHDSMAVVQQSPNLFNLSLSDNIAYGVPGNVPTSAEIEAAAKLANCHEFISDFRAGYDVFAGGSGASLSGGQRQRIAIARAVLRNPRILVLDEATSALDAENEATVMAALENIMQNRTTVIIAHRLSTVVNADEIVCMDQGGVVERGTHTELMNRRGTYFELVRKQTSSSKLSSP